jgi:hypothetical protein
MGYQWDAVGSTAMDIQWKLVCMIGILALAGVNRV